MNRTNQPDRKEHGLVQRLRRDVRELPVSSPHVLLACSGGKDSVALAWLLAELQRLHLLTFELAHVHHGQHDCANEAAEAVQAIADRLTVPCHTVFLGNDDFARHPGVGLEEAMRRERYLALARIACQISADCIALAHHQSDQAETLLLHLMRGAGIDGLAGMRVWEHRSIPWWSDESGPEIALWRPLLAEPQAHIADIAQTSGLPITEDPTNTDTSYRRNAIRHQLLPVMEQIAPGATAATARSATVIAQDADLLEQLTRQSLTACRHGANLHRSWLVRLLPGMQQRVIRAWILQQVPTLELSTERIMAVVQLAQRNRGGAAIELGSGVRIALRQGELHIESCENSSG